ncbi:NAD dependent epimerase/dehydratase family protein [compost metagenome]
MIDSGWELTLINRGNRASELDERVQLIQADIHNEAQVSELLADKYYDVVVDFIAFSTADLERDYRLFRDKTNQFIFISSASAYQKPLSNYIINEGTPLANPYWEYSREKIAGEEFLMDKYRQEGFPITIVRPSHTYNEWKLAGAKTDA